MECLAPAGNREALERAEAAGADAVYLGYAAFSARAGAGNFDRQELEDAIRFAHLRHMRVHVTVNTLVKDGELGRVTEVLRLIKKYKLNISYISSQENGSAYQAFKMGLYIEDENILYLRITNFDQHITADATKFIKEQPNAKGIILDLRNNLIYFSLWQIIVKLH